MSYYRIAHIAQLVEHTTDTREVLGSIPSVRTLLKVRCIISKMPKSRIIPVIGFLIALLPILGFPHAWEIFFQIVSGLSIVGLSILISIDKRLMQKSKAEKRMVTLRKKTEMEVETDTQPLNNESGISS